MQICSHAVPAHCFPQLHSPQAGSVGALAEWHLRGSPCVFLSMQERRVVWIWCVDGNEVCRPSQPQENALHARVMA